MKNILNSASSTELILGLFCKSAQIVSEMEGFVIFLTPEYKSSDRNVPLGLSATSHASSFLRSRTCSRAAWSLWGRIESSSSIWNGNTSFISSSKCKTSLQNYSSTDLSQETTVAKVDHQDLKESRGHSDVISSCIGDPYHSYCEEVRGQGLHSTWTGSAQREILEMCLASDLLCKRAQSGSFVRP